MSKKRKKKSPIQSDSDMTIEEISKIDPELEERILKEADNDFFDEDTKSRTSIYRSKFFRKWEQEQTNTFIKNKNSVAQDEPPKLSHAEKAGFVIAVVMLIYSIANADKPLLFMALSLFIHFIRPAVGALFGKYNQDVQNALRTFSFVLFAGALLFLFMD